MRIKQRLKLSRFFLSFSARAEIKRRGCMGPGRVSYEHGDVMQRACDQVCTCDNGGKACKKLCPQLLISVPDLFKQPYCVDARSVPVPRHWTGHLTCASERPSSAQNLQLVTTAYSRVQQSSVHALCHRCVFNCLSTGRGSAVAVFR